MTGATTSPNQPFGASNNQRISSSLGSARKSGNSIRGNSEFLQKLADTISLDTSLSEEDDPTPKNSMRTTEKASSLGPQPKKVSTLERSPLFLKRIAEIAAATQDTEEREMIHLAVGNALHAVVAKDEGRSPKEHNSTRPKTKTNVDVASVQLHLHQSSGSSDGKYSLVDQSKISLNETQQVYSSTTPVKNSNSSPNSTVKRVPPTPPQDIVSTHSPQLSSIHKRMHVDTKLESPISKGKHSSAPLHNATVTDPVAASPKSFTLNKHFQPKLVLNENRSSHSVIESPTMTSKKISHTSSPTIKVTELVASKLDHSMDPNKVLSPSSTLSQNALFLRRQAVVAASEQSPSQVYKDGDMIDTKGYDKTSPSVSPTVRNPKVPDTKIDQGLTDATEQKYHVHQNSKIQSPTSSLTENALFLRRRAIVAASEQTGQSARNDENETPESNDSRHHRSNEHNDVLKDGNRKAALLHRPLTIDAKATPTSPRGIQNNPMVTLLQSDLFLKRIAVVDGDEHKTEIAGKFTIENDRHQKSNSAIRGYTDKKQYSSPEKSYDPSTRALNQLSASSTSLISSTIGENVIMSSVSDDDFNSYASNVSTLATKVREQSFFEVHEATNDYSHSKNSSTEEISENEGEDSVGNFDSESNYESLNQQFHSHMLRTIHDRQEYDMAFPDDFSRSCDETSFISSQGQARGDVWEDILNSLNSDDIVDAMKIESSDLGQDSSKDTSALETEESVFEHSSFVFSDVMFSQQAEHQSFDKFGDTNRWISEMQTRLTLNPTDEHDLATNFEFMESSFPIQADDEIFPYASKDGSMDEVPYFNNTSLHSRDFPSQEQIQTNNMINGTSPLGSIRRKVKDTLRAKSELASFSRSGQNDDTVQTTESESDDVLATGWNQDADFSAKSDLNSYFDNRQVALESQIRFLQNVSQGRNAAIDSSTIFFNDNGDITESASSCESDILMQEKIISSTVTPNGRKASLKHIRDRLKDFRKNFKDPSLSKASQSDTEINFIAMEKQGLVEISSHSDDPIKIGIAGNNIVATSSTASISNGRIVNKSVNAFDVTTSAVGSCPLSGPYQLLLPRSHAPQIVRISPPTDTSIFKNLLSNFDAKPTHSAEAPGTGLKNESNVTSFVIPQPPSLKKMDFDELPDTWQQTSSVLMEQTSTDAMFGISEPLFPNKMRNDGIGTSLNFKEERDASKQPNAVLGSTYVPSPDVPCDDTVFKSVQLSSNISGSEVVAQWWKTNYAASQGDDVNNIIENALFQRSTVNAIVSEVKTVDSLKNDEDDVFSGLRGSSEDIDVSSSLNVRVKVENEDPKNRLDAGNTRYDTMVLFEEPLPGDNTDISFISPFTAKEDRSDPIGDSSRHHNDIMTATSEITFDVPSGHEQRRFPPLIGATDQVSSTSMDFELDVRRKHLLPERNEMHSSNMSAVLSLVAGTLTCSMFEPLIAAFNESSSNHVSNEEATRRGRRLVVETDDIYTGGVGVGVADGVNNNKIADGALDERSYAGTEASSQILLSKKEKKVWDSWEKKDQDTHPRLESLISHADERRAKAHEKLLNHAYIALSLVSRNSSHFQEITQRPLVETNECDEFSLNPSADSMRCLERFCVAVKNGMSLLKLNRDKKWYVRYLTVSEEGSMIKFGGDSTERGYCPLALLWTKKINKLKGHSVFSIDSEGRGGVLCTHIVRVEESSDILTQFPLTKRQLRDYPDSVAVRIYSEDKGEMRFVTLRCSQSAATLIITGCNAIIALLRGDSEKNLGLDLTSNGIESSSHPG